MKRRSPHLGIRTSARGLRIESLECRRVFAADLSHLQPALTTMADSASADVAESLHNASVAEGEQATADDLVAFAKVLKAGGVRLFCAAWNPACSQQQRLFEDGADFLPFVETTDPDQTFNQTAIDEGITSLPTWQFSGGQRVLGLLTLDEIAAHAGIAIPQSAEPFIAPMPDRVVPVGSPLQIPVNAYDPNGDRLSVSVEVSDGSLVSTRVLSGNRSLRLETDYGDMTFELFEGRAPRPAHRVIQLAESGFYDGVIFHRVIDNFMIQGGDPLGNGLGGSALGSFDDQFHLELQHNTSGLLSFAKTNDDTNNSQFFITDRATRHLDFNHSIFGVLTEGGRTRDAINNTATDAGNRPINEVVIRKATVVDDVEDSVFVLLPNGGENGSTTVTVTVTDPDGNSAVESFRVEVVADNVNTPPFLRDIVNPTTTENTRVKLQLESVDREGDPVGYILQPLSPEPFGLAIGEDGVVDITPPVDYVGDLYFRANVVSIPPVTGQADSQIVRVSVVSSHQNRANRLDVNNDGVVSPQDALIVINFLNGTTSNGAVSSLDAPPYRDVNGDLFVTPADVLLIVNYLNAEAAGEGETHGETISELIASHRPSEQSADDEACSDHATNLAIPAIDLDEKWKLVRDELVALLAAERQFSCE